LNSSALSFLFDCATVIITTMKFSHSHSYRRSNLAADSPLPPVFMYSRR
jgi:hypothetical protein